ncbi:hypothetical protein [Actinomadura roseirufa]|uniref:hypothetical protein n=1 Tax=Actinomadura roseirufa TaxID=2094049 RepID=UPI001041A89F|nr:hypothetical protein [Actinomadura roseirufa]
MPIIRYEVDEKGATEVADAVQKTFSTLEERRPEGVRYAYYRAAGGTEFVAPPDLDEGTGNPLPDIEAARRPQAAVAEHVMGDAPTPRTFDLIDA